MVYTSLLGGHSIIKDNLENRQAAVNKYHSCDFQDDSEANLERKLAIHDVVNCEDGYITQMQCGIQRFSRPLRHCIGSSMQHATLFQNVEKVRLQSFVLSLP